MSDQQITRVSARFPADADARRAFVDLPLADLAAALAARPYVRRGVSAGERVVRVVLADDHELVRAGLRALLKSVQGIEIVGEAASAPEAAIVTERLRPDVIVMDLAMVGAEGGTVIRELVGRDRDCRVLVLTMQSENERLIELLREGASGFLGKDSAERDLIDAIRVVAQGEIYVRPQLARMLAAGRRLDSDVEAPRRATVDTLSERERAVLLMTAQGYSATECGRRLGISNKTVDTYKHRIEEKLGVRHRTAYVRIALDAGLL